LVRCAPGRGREAMAVNNDYGRAARCTSTRARFGLVARPASGQSGMFVTMIEAPSVLQLSDQTVPDDFLALCCDSKNDQCRQPERHTTHDTRHTHTRTHTP
jgi:hypothetical protein